MLSPEIWLLSSYISQGQRAYSEGRQVGLRIHNALAPCVTLKEERESKSASKENAG